MQKPIITITLAYSAGLLLGYGLLFFPITGGMFITLGLLISGVLVWLDKLSLRRVLFIAIPGLIGAAAYLSSAAWFPSDHYTRILTPDNKTHEIVGTITSPLDRDPDRIAFYLDVRTIDGARATGTMRVSVREETALIGYGDTVRVLGKVFKPRGFYNPGGFDYPAYLAQKGVSYTVSVKDFSKIKSLKQGQGIFRSIQDWRERIRQSFLVSTTGTGSAILQAMVIGEEGGLTDDLRDRFMAAGVTHIISISGSHLGMVAVLCFGLLRSLLFLLPERWYHYLTLQVDPKKIAAWLTLPLVLFYALLAGGQVATLRSLIMISVGLLALILDRDHALMHFLALAALFILLASPQALFDISFQLSYLSVLVIGAVVTLWSELQQKQQGRLRKLGNNTLLLIAVSLAASLAVGPLAAFYFNQFSYAGILSNIIVVPFAGIVVVPLGLLSAILSLFLQHLPMAALNQLMSDVFILVVDFFAGLPFAEFHPPAPGIAWLLCYACFLLSLGTIARGVLLARIKPLETSLRPPKRAVIIAAILGGMLLLIPAYSMLRSGGPDITFLDVGQGDCAFIQLGSGRTILIDGGGTHDNRFDIGRRVVAPYLWNQGVRSIDLVILSHPHPDHMNGLLYILRKFDVAQVWDSERDPDVPGYAEFRKIIAERNIPRKTISAEEGALTLGNAVVRVLHPSPSFRGDEKQSYAAENNRSLVVRLAFENKTFLFSGDIGAKAEQYLLRAQQDLKCDLLKAPHHGSKSSSSDPFIAGTLPEVAVISVGSENRYRHPSEEVLARYTEKGVAVRRTDQDGGVVVAVKNGRLHAVGWKELRLVRIAFADAEGWGAQERQNWRRLESRITSK